MSFENIKDFLTTKEFPSHGSSHIASIGGIPWLFTHPEQSLMYWFQKKEELLSSILQRQKKIESDITKHSPTSKTYFKFKELSKALKFNYQQLEELLAPLEVNAFVDSNTPTTKKPKRTSRDLISQQFPSHQNLSIYFSNLFRDWSWNSNENEITVNTLCEVLSSSWSPSNLLVLGAGAGRLCHDLSERFTIKNLMAVDINPLLIFSAQKIFQGKALNLYEIPTFPFLLENTCQLRTLKSPLKSNLSINSTHNSTINSVNNSVNNFVNNSTNDYVNLIFADALELPFKADSIESVLTPWFIDIIPCDFNKLAQRINRLLKIDGEWLNLGPLGFMHAEESDRLTWEEMKELFQLNGFKLQKEVIRELPYLQSPQSPQRRFENVIVFKAIKTHSVLLENFELFPLWLRDHSRPIPLSSEIKQHQLLAKTNADLFFSIDGKQSINSLMSLMSQHYGITESDAKINIVTLLTRFYESKKRVLF